MPIKNQPKNMIFIIVLCISFCLLTVFTIVTIIQISNTDTEIKREEQALQENQDKLTELTKLVKNKDEFKKSIELMTKMIPNKADESGIIKIVQNMSLESSVEFIKIEFGDRVVNNNMNTMSMTMSFSGDYDSLIKLVGKIESSSRLIRIDQMKMFINETTKAINADITARTFYR